MSEPATTQNVPKGRRRKTRNIAVRLATQLALVVVASTRTGTISAFSVVSLEAGQDLSRSSLRCLSPWRQQFASGGRPIRTSRRILQGVSEASSTIYKHGRRRRPEMVASPIELETTTDATITSSSTTSITTREVCELTMADVVASASIEIEQQQQDLKYRQRENFKTPFEWFEDHDKARVIESEKVGLDRLRNGKDNPEPEIDSKWDGRIDPSSIVSWNDLKALLETGIHSATASSSSSSSSSSSTHDLEDCVERRVLDLYRSFEDSGGILVVRLDEEDSSTVADMWSTMEAYFSLPTDKQQVAKQVLEKEDGSQDPEAGYNFMMTYMNVDGEILPETIQNSLNNNNNDDAPNCNDGCDTHTRAVEGSHKLFAEICKTVGTIMAAGALEKDLVLMDKVATSMLDHRNGHPFVNAEHRLCQYILGSQQQQKVTAKESLISHTDWTFTTCIPLSSIPGLQVWKPLSREWVVPEAILGGDDRTNYVVVMAGKWIELLTNRKITSCVHRVVTMPQKGPPKPRLSAPFFCRTKRPIFDLFQDEFHQSWNEPSSGNVLSQEQAIFSMSKLFGDWIRFLEGDRDTDIPGCVIDLGVDRADQAPRCFSIEEILGE